MGRSDDEKGADKAVAIRRSQQKERARLLAGIDVEQKKVSALSEERAPLAAEFRKVESEVGPIKYIAALIYGDNPDANILERAVRWVIILIVAVFDPLALVLILAAQQTLRWAQEDRENKPAVEQVIVEEKEILNEAEPETKTRFFSWPLPGNLNWPFPKKDEPEPLVVTNSNPEDNVPLVAKTEDQVAQSINPEPPIVTLRNFTDEEIAAMDAVQTGPMKEVVEELIDPNTRIRTLNHKLVPDNDEIGRAHV